jgi:hypothetical protein
LVREQVAPVVLGAAVGLLCGIVSSVLAMPMVPLFDSAADPVPPLQLTPAWGSLLAVAVAATVALGFVAWLSAAGAGRRISLRRIRDAL